MKFKAGKYFVGDPCYAIRDDEWMELLEHSDYFGMNGIGAWGGFWKGYKIFAASTAFGDGCFYDNQGREYGVDAGMLGIVPYEYITEFGSIHGGNVIEFEKDFEVREEHGIFDFGHIHINTQGVPQGEFCEFCGYTHGECHCDDSCLECGRLLDDGGICWYCDEEEEEC